MLYFICGMLIYLTAYANAADPLIYVIYELLLIRRSLHRSTAWA